MQYMPIQPSFGLVIPEFLDFGIPGGSCNQTPSKPRQEPKWLLVCEVIRTNWVKEHQQLL